MSKTLEQILGAENLVGVIQGIKNGIPADILPPQFLRVTRTVEGNRATYHRVEGTRKTARQVHYGAPSTERQKKGVEEVPVNLLHSIEHENHNPTVLLNLKQIGNEQRQKLGRDEIARQVGLFNTLFENLRLASVYSIFRDGHIYFDGDGNLLNSSAGAALDVNMQIADNNKGQLNGIIAASWATAGTKIHTQIKNLKKEARKLTGYRLTDAFYGENILDHFLTNTALSAIINRNTTLQEAFAGGEIPDGFLGLRWHPIYEAFFEDNDDTNQEFIDGDAVVFTPTPSPEWWEVIEGTYPVPTNIGNLSSDALGALGNIMEVAGKFSYAKVTDDPVGIKHVAGDTFLPVLKVPNAIFLADTVF